MGGALLLSPDFTDFSAMPPEEFVDEVLVRRLGAAVVCCGDDFRFGRDAAGDVPMLKTLCAARGVEVDVVPAVLWGGERVSSTRIRRLLGEGEVETAGELLGRAFGYDFTVVHGKRLGRTIDSPTINQRFPADFVRLRHGVYAAAARVDGVLRPAVTNIGLRRRWRTRPPSTRRPTSSAFRATSTGRRSRCGCCGFCGGSGSSRRSGSSNARFRRTRRPPCPSRNGTLPKKRKIKGHDPFTFGQHYATINN